jgi:nitroreductase
MSNFLENQNWRYATKKFNATKKISITDLNFLKEAMRLSSSSYGLQLYKILIVENPEIRAQLLPHAWNQSQIVDASHLIVFANQTHIGNAEIDAYLQNTSTTRNIPFEAFSGYGNFMKNAINPLSEELKNIWTSKQTYLALGNLLNAAAELKIDTTPMEGFDAEKFNEILGLNALNLNAAVVATIGYRSDEDATQHDKKVRKSNEELFLTI